MAFGVDTGGVDAGDAGGVWRLVLGVDAGDAGDASDVWHLVLMLELLMAFGVWW